jgi:acetyl esterase/lipase
VGGGSAGGHLALLAAFSAHRSDLTPPDLIETDTSVRGAVDYYPPVTIAAYYNNGYQTSVSFGLLKTPIRQEVVSMLMGGSPQEAPEAYSLFSPSSHVSPSCPPTLIFAPELDDIVPVGPIAGFHRSLVDASVHW